MAERRVIHVDIQGQRYAISSELDPKYVSDVAAYVDRKMERVGRELATTDSLRLAVMAAQFARDADFFSIGTNDLTQYTLAMDRGHPKLAPLVDGLSPAVLRLIGHTVKGARAQKRRVAVCGGIASDPRAVPILVGIGVDELSVSLPEIPAVKAQIRSLQTDACRALADGRSVR